MSTLKTTLGAASLTLAAAATSWAGDSYAPRQYYSQWQKAPQSTYAYRTYYYKPTPDYAGYKHHYVIQKGDHNYFYNPYEKKYWGRCPTQTWGKPQYQLLAPADRKPSLAQIPESAFPPAGPLPPIPDSQPGDSATLDLPPDDLPSDVFVGN